LGLPGCEHCDASIDAMMLRVYYCGRGCQTAHWAAHKAAGGTPLKGSCVRCAACTYTTSSFSSVVGARGADRRLTDAVVARSTTRVIDALLN
jgi:hypothetical protein